MNKTDKTNGKIIILRCETLEIETRNYNPETKIKDYINCDWIDHTSVFDEMERRNIDVWLDDEGILKNKNPTFIFAENNDILGVLVGDLCFLQVDRDGETHGLDTENYRFTMEWIKKHRILELDTGLLRGEEESRKIIRCYLVNKSETEEHRKRISEMRKFFEENGGEIIDI